MAVAQQPEMVAEVGLRAPTRDRRASSASAALWCEHQAAIVRTAAVLAAVGGWEALARSGAVHPLFLSGPSQVAGRLAQLFASGAIWPHVLVSAQEVLLGFGLAIVVGVPIGAAMGRAPLLRHALEPLVMAKHASPTVAFLPLLIIWLGIGLWSKVALIFLAAVFVLIINTEAGVSGVERRLVETARSFTANEWQVMTKVVLPAATPYILAGLRVAVGRVLIVMVVAEMFASTAGLGHLVFQGAAMYDTTLVFAGVTILAATGIVLNQALRALERRIAPWLQSDQES